MTHCCSTSDSSLKRKRNDNEAQSSRSSSSLKIEFSERGVPQQLTDGMTVFNAMLQQTGTCFFCSQTFDGRSIGALACRFHPFVYYNRGANVMGAYDPYLHLPPSSCRICSALHLARPECEIEPARGSGSGCTRIDHAISPFDLFAKPYLAIPTTFLGGLDIVLNTRAAGAGDNNSVLRQLKRMPNVIIVHRRSQLSKILRVDMPGSSHGFECSIVQVYEQMATEYGLPLLEDEVLAARAADPTSRITKQVEMNPDARRKDALRAQFKRKVLFAPFIILARIQQSAEYGQPMTLVKPNSGV